MMIYLPGWETPRWFNKAHLRLCFWDNQIMRVLICGRVWFLGSRILEWDGRAAGDGSLGQCPPMELHLILPMVASLSSSHPGTLLCFLGTVTSHHMLLPSCLPHQRAKSDSKNYRLSEIYAANYNPKANRKDTWLFPLNLLHFEVMCPFGISLDM